MAAMKLVTLVPVLAIVACGAAPQNGASSPAPAGATGPAVAIARAGSAAPAPRAFAVAVRGHGPAVILIPGLASSGEVWASTVAHLAGRYTCHVVTLAGFAGQPAIAAPMLAAVRSALAAYIRDQRLEHPVIVGHSLGGFLALDLAQAEPSLVGPLVIVDSLPFLTAAFDPHATAESAKLFAEPMRATLAKATPDVFRARMRDTVATMVTSPADQATVLAWGVASDPASVGNAMAELMETDLRDAVAAITVPALVIGTWQGRPGGSRAETDRIFHEQYARLRGAEISIADRARHFVMLDDPAFLFAQVDAFLGRARVVGR